MFGRRRIAFQPASDLKGLFFLLEQMARSKQALPTLLRYDVGRTSQRRNYVGMAKSEAQVRRAACESEGMGSRRAKAYSLLTISQFWILSLSKDARLSWSRPPQRRVDVALARTRYGNRVPMGGRHTLSEMRVDSPAAQGQRRMDGSRV